MTNSYLTIPFFATKVYGSWQKALTVVSKKVVYLQVINHIRVKMKIKHLVLVAFLAAFFVSCKDESGRYATTIYTESELHNAYRECLISSTDTALAHLCVTDGFYRYNNQHYRLKFPTSISYIADTLTSHGEGCLVDSLMLHINRLAETCGSSFRTFFVTCINDLSYPEPSRFIETTDKAALTNYFKSLYYNNLRSSIIVPFQLKMMVNEVNGEWENLITAYRQYDDEGVVAINLYDNLTVQILDGIFEEIAKEEKLIRTDDNHKVTDNLIYVFQ